MEVTAWQILNTTRGIWISVEGLLQPFLKNLDPSLFQNIILGILAIFIPFAIVFLTDVLDSKKQRNAFEKMVLSNEVLGAKKVFWLSVFGIGVLSFFSGKDISILEKLFAIVLSLFLIFFFGKFFRKTLKFSEGYKPEFEISFLKGLNLSKIFRFRNKIKSERMVRAWSSFWSEKSEYNEREFTRVFITHIDDSFKTRKFGLAVQLSQSYIQNLEKRDRFSIGYEILPKIFEWNERFWNEQQTWLNRRSYEEKIQKAFPIKYFPTFRKWALYVLKRVYAEDDFFWNWHSFQQEFFPAVAKILLYDGHGDYQLLSCFKNHIEGSEAKLEKLKNSAESQKQWNYIMGLFSSFCPIFFENIDNVSGKFNVWEHYFPGDWKITMANSKKRIPRVILHEFQQWAHQRIFKKNDSDYDTKLTEVVNGIFPNVHHGLFPSFLALLFSGEIKYAIQKEPNFSIINTGISWSGEKSEEEINEMSRQKELSQKQETIEVIFIFFEYWRLLKLYKDDLSEEEYANWTNYPEEKRKQIASSIRRNKLQKVLNELNGSEINEMCKDSEILESRRMEFIDLVQLLLKHIAN